MPTTGNAGDYVYTTTDSTITNSGSITIDTPTYTIEPKYGEYIIPYMGPYKEENLKTNKKGGDDMRYLYEVILVNPKNDTFKVDKVVAKSETSAILKAYEYSDFADSGLRVDFDDLKTSCRVLMEWKKEKSLKKAIETIKEAVE